MDRHRKEQPLSMGAVRKCRRAYDTRRGPIADRQAARHRAPEAISHGTTWNQFWMADAAAACDVYYVLVIIRIVR